MLEKDIPFELKNEVPWDSTTETPTHNPLEKLPILLFDDGRPPVYDSSHIQEYLVQKYADKEPRLLTGSIDLDLQARQIQVLAQGILDSFVLLFFETSREEDKQSKPWSDRQNRKIDGGFKALNELAKTRKPQGTDYLLNDQFTIADIAACCAVTQVEFGGTRPNWKKDYPDLASYWQKLESRESFKSTYPVMFDIKDKIV